MRRAALLGDGWLPFLYSPSRYATSVATIRAMAVEAGRSLDGFEWLCFVYTSMNPDAAVARERALRVIGGAQVGDGSRFEPLLDRVAAVGTPEQVREWLQAMLDAGARHLVLVPCDEDRVTGARQLLDDVVPALRLSTPG
jgi:alkanesulfonate monooxygenase SsuD/methylene tetrahydromethanopterin reductase-like flavin-dependent oxidoreductase (luciferase family)